MAEQPDLEGARPGDVKATPYAWYVLSVLVLVYAFNFIDRQILSVLNEDIKRDLHVTDADMGFLYGTAFAVFYAVFGIPLGRLADNWIRVRLVSVGLAVWSGMTMLSGIAVGFPQLAAARIGVGVGEASSGPGNFSMLSDWFPRRQRATALAIFSSGIYLGGGLSALIGASVKSAWDKAYPHGTAPLGLVGWQAAFLAVGFPGILLALWVATLREPVRGAADGLPTPPATDVWPRFWADLSSVLPPLTFFHLARRSRPALFANLGVALGLAALAWTLIRLTGNRPQWLAMGLGCYCVTSWVQSLKITDRPTYALIWGTPAMRYALLGFGLISFVGYALGYWIIPYAIRTFGVSAKEAGTILGGIGAGGGFIGIVTGGWLADWAKRRNPGGRILVAGLALLVPAPLILFAFTTTDKSLFYLSYIPVAIFGSCYIGVAAATTQDLVLPRMRGAATATYVIGTTMLGLGLGPYAAGAISKATGSLGTGIMWLLAGAPITFFCLWRVYRLLPAAEASRVARAVAAGEIITGSERI